jgi:1,2-dihydroxy-3-keto-5-methylthiopentene dioxygenase
MPFVFLPCSSSTSSLLTSSFTWSRTDQRLPHNSGEPVSPDELTRLGLVYYHIPVEGEWEEGVGAFSLHFYCPLCLAMTEWSGRALPGKEGNAYWRTGAWRDEGRTDQVAKERDYKNRDVINVSKAGLGDAYEDKIKVRFVSSFSFPLSRLGE